MPLWTDTISKSSWAGYTAHTYLIKCYLRDWFCRAFDLKTDFLVLILKRASKSVWLLSKEDTIIWMRLEIALEKLLEELGGEALRKGIKTIT